MPRMLRIEIDSYRYVLLEPTQENIERAAWLASHPLYKRVGERTYEGNGTYAPADDAVELKFVNAELLTDSEVDRLRAELDEAQSNLKSQRGTTEYLRREIEKMKAEAEKQKCQYVQMQVPAKPEPEPEPDLD